MTDAANQSQSRIADVATAIGISVSVSLSKDHAITMQTHVPLDGGPSGLSLVSDMLARNADRLIAHYRVRELRKQLVLLEVQYKHMVEDLARIDAQHKAALEASGKRSPQLNNAQQAEKQNALTTKERFAQNIELCKKEISELEKEAT